MIEQIAHAAMKVPQEDGRSMVYNDVIAECDKVRLEQYMEMRSSMIASGTLSEEAPLIADIAHNPGQCTKVSRDLLNTLTTNHHRWSYHHKRAMFGVESLAAQGVPTRPVVDALARTRSDSALVANILLSKPKLSQVSESSMKTLAGNGMHLHVCGAIFAWTLAHCELPEQEALTGPSAPSHSHAPEAAQRLASRDFSGGCRYRSCAQSRAPDRA